MVIFLPKVKSFGEEIGASLGGGLGSGIGQGLEELGNRKEQQKISEKLKSITGMDLSGLPVELQKSALAESLKTQGKEKLFKGKQDYLNQIFGGGQQAQNTPQDEFTNQIMGEMKSQGIDPGKLTDQQIAQASTMDPNLGRLLQQQKDVALREQRAERDFKERQKEKSPEFQREQKITAAQATSDVKYNQELQAAHKQHEIKTHTLNRLEELNKKGVTGKPYEKILEKSGLINLTSEGRREFAADVKNLITDIRSILGGQFSTFEFQTILNAYPSADFSQKANESIIKNLKDFQDIRNQEFKIAKDLKKENGGKVPEDFQSLVNERLQEYAQSKLPEIKANSKKIMNEEYGIPEGNVLMFDPQGEPLNVSPEEVERYQSLGATLP